MITIKDVAKFAGVSEKTAMRALSGQTIGKRSDAKERADKVLAAAAKLGYRQSALAKSLRQQKTNKIGLIINNITNRYYASLAEIVLKECERLGYKLIIELTFGDDKKTSDSIESLLENRVDGIFYASNYQDEMKIKLQEIHNLGIPMIGLYANKYIPAVSRSYDIALSQAIQYLKAQNISTITLAYWFSNTLNDEILTELFQTTCHENQIKTKIFPLHNLADIENLKNDEAIICDAPYCLKHFFDIKNTSQNPQVIGIYDEWNYIEHPQTISGAIMIPAEKQAQNAVKQLIAEINQKDFTPTQHPAVFYPKDQIKNIIATDLAFLYIQ